MRGQRFVNAHGSQHIQSFDQFVARTSATASEWRCIAVVRTCHTAGIIHINFGTGTLPKAKLNATNQLHAEFRRRRQLALSS